MSPHGDLIEAIILIFSVALFIGAAIVYTAVALLVWLLRRKRRDEPVMRLKIPHRRMRR